MPASCDFCEDRHLPVDDDGLTADERSVFEGLRVRVQFITERARNLSSGDWIQRLALRRMLDQVIDQQGYFILDYKEAADLLLWPGEPYYSAGDYRWEVA